MSEESRLVEPTAPANFKFLATVKNLEHPDVPPELGLDFDIHDVLCEVYLPRRITEKARVRLLPTERQFSGLRNLFRFGITGNAGNELIVAEIVNLEGGGHHTWPSGVQDIEWIGRPADLTITSATPEPAHRAATFYLTKNVYLRPWKFLEPVITGEIALRLQDRFAFPILADGTWVTFDNHFRRYPVDDGILSFPELVAQCEPSACYSFERIVSELDDFLLIVSFATRQRVACMGWSFAESNIRTTRYRLDRVVPRLMPNHSFNDTLIFEEDFIKFLIRTYPRFREHQQHGLLRQALQRLTLFRDRDTTTETRYLGLYAALETAVQLFGESCPEARLIMPKDQWKDLLKALKKNIHSCPIPEDKRALLYPTVISMNRAPLRTVVEDLCAAYEIDLSDVWPLADSTEGISLTTIRNKLVHGYLLGDEFSRSLWVARTHLEWIVERLLLAILGWHPREHSLVHWMPLQRFKPYEKSEWQKARATLSGARS